MPPPPRFPSSSSFNLTSLQGREGGGGGRDVDGAAAAAAHLIAHPGGSGRRRLFSSSSIQGLLLRSTAGGPRQHHSRLLLPPAASRPWSCDSLGAAAAAARGDGIRGGDGPGRSGTPRRQQRQRGAFFFSSSSAPLLLGPDMEDGSNSASCFRRFTDCFLNTSRYRPAERTGGDEGPCPRLGACGEERQGHRFLCERGGGGEHTKGLRERGVRGRMEKRRGCTDKGDARRARALCGGRICIAPAPGVTPRVCVSAACCLVLLNSLTNGTGGAGAAPPARSEGR